MRRLVHALRTILRGVAGTSSKPTRISTAALIAVCLTAPGCRQNRSSDLTAFSEKEKQLFAAQLMQAYIRYVQSTGAPLEKFGITLKTDPKGATCTAKCEGATVTCTGSSCSGVDGKGCTASDSDNNPTQLKLCITSAPPIARHPSDREASIPLAP